MGGILMTDQIIEYENGADAATKLPETIIAGLNNDHAVKWFVMAGAGLLTIGLGISFIGESIIRKREGRPWFGVGSIGIAAFNLGLSMFGDAVKHRMLYEIDDADVLSEDAS